MKKYKKAIQGVLENLEVRDISMYEYRVLKKRYELLLRHCDEIESVYMGIIGE